MNYTALTLVPHW